jgi:RNA polymerase-binding transcription factor DksA
MSAREDKERTSDLLDHASSISEHFRAAAERRARQAAQPEYHPAFDGLHCVEEDCGEEIPALRVQAGRVRCVDCQSRIERLGR